MEQASKHHRLAIEIVLIEESSGDSTRAEVEEINIEIAEDTVLANNNYIGEEEAEGPEEEEEDSEEDELDEEEEEENMEPCDWCGIAVRPDWQRQLVMVGEEDICRDCFDNSDQELNSEGELDYPQRHFMDEDEGAETDVSVIELTDSENEE